MVRRRVCSATHRLHPIAHKPMETLDEKQESKHNSERNVKLIPEDCKGQQGLRYEHPSLII